MKALQALLPGLHVVVVEGASHFTADARGAAKRPEFVKAVRDLVAAHRSAMSQ